MKTEEHEKLRELTAFQHWLGTNYTTLPTDSGEMTKRAILYNKFNKEFDLKECYIVMVSSGEWEDNIKFHTGTIFLSLLSAEKEKQKIEEYYKTRTPFPFNYCTEQEFVKLLYRGKVLEEEGLIYDEWLGKKYEQGEFKGCWIEKLNLKDNYDI